MRLESSRLTSSIGRLINFFKGFIQGLIFLVNPPVSPSAQHFEPRAVEVISEPDNISQDAAPNPQTVKEFKEFRGRLT